MQFKVPQDVQREDIILWFITFKQFVILLLGGGISYVMFVNMNKHYRLNTFEEILVWIPAMVAIAFSFIKIKGIPLFQFILLMIENIFFRPPRRFWIQGAGEPFVSFTTPFEMKKKKVVPKPVMKKVSDEKLKNLAVMMDGGKNN